jgi:hypothetical protein
VEKGWQVAPADKADVVVVLHGATDKKKSLDTFYTGGYGGYRWGGMGGSSQTTVHEYTVGTLVTDMFDAKSKNLSGAAPRRTSSRTRPRRTPRRVAKAGDKLFKDFPPGSAREVGAGERLFTGRRRQPSTAGRGMGAVVRRTGSRVSPSSA